MIELSKRELKVAGYAVWRFINEAICRREWYLNRSNRGVSIAEVEALVASFSKDIADAEAVLRKIEALLDGLCKKCGGTMLKGSALVDIPTGSPDFPKGEVVTLSPSGKAKLVNCLKCESCGHSIIHGSIETGE